MSYQIVHNLIIFNEMSTSKFLWKGTKQLGRNIRKDPLSAAIMAAPFPGALAVGGGLHLVKSKPSRQVFKTRIAKLLNPNRPKAGERKRLELDKKRKEDLIKYLKVSKLLK